MNDLQQRTQRLYRCAFWALVAGTTLLRLLLAGRLGLSVDESHYFVFSRHLAWGYFDHPPMVAFLCALTTLAGDSLIFIRLGPILCSALALILLRQLALLLYRDERPAVWAALLLLCMPVYHLIAVALLPDATLNLFWCGALVASWQAFRGGRWSMWISAGVMFGLALLSKYHGALLPVCLLCYALSSREQRRWLARPHPYVAIAVGLAVFLPNILWNAQHEWISYAYQFAHGRGSAQFTVRKFAETLGGQMAASSPVVFLMLAAAFIALAIRRLPEESDRFLFWTSFPVFALFCGMGVTGKILPHWPFVGWWSGSLLLVSVVMRAIPAPGAALSGWRRWMRAAVAVAVPLLVLMYLAIFTPLIGPAYRFARGVSVSLHQRWPAIPAMQPYGPHDDITNDLYGWDQVAARAEGIRARMPQAERTFVFCHRFYETSLVAAHLKRDTVPAVLSRKPNQYRLWFDPLQHEGWDALFLDDAVRPEGPERYAPLFTGIDPDPIRIEVLRDAHAAHTLNAYRCYGFKGRFE